MTATPATDGALARTWSPGGPLDLGSTLGPMRRGAGDPTFRYERPGGLWRTSRTPEGPATPRLTVRPADGEAIRKLNQVPRQKHDEGPAAVLLGQRVAMLLGVHDDEVGSRERGRVEARQQPLPHAVAHAPVGRGVAGPDQVVEDQGHMGTAGGPAARRSDRGSPRPPRPASCPGSGRRRAGTARSG